MNDCCIVIITHKEILKDSDEISFLRALNVFKNRDIKLLIPDNISKLYYNSFKNNYNFEIIPIDHKWLSDYESYNHMLRTSEFYELFNDYKYILIYQTDCYVFEDKLDYFIKLGYDWYGAPWPHVDDMVGNGGLSLRKVDKMIDITSKYLYDEHVNEDLWFCLYHGDEINACDLKTACNFSIENMSEKYKELINAYPMGVHDKKMRKFWEHPEKLKLDKTMV